MDKTDTRIKKKQYNTTESSEPQNSNLSTNTLTNTTSAQGPCDDCGNPIVPPKPTPNPNRPKRKTDDTGELIYTNGIQKEGNYITVKVHPDSTSYMRTSKDGVSIKFLANKLECVNKSIKKLKNNVEQLKAEVQPGAIAEKIVESSKEFYIDREGLLSIKTGDGLIADDNGYLKVKVDNETIGFDEQGNLMTIWTDFNME